MLKSSSLCLYSSNLGTFWLKIEQFWPFEEISIFSNGGYKTVLTDTILKVDHPRIISAKFGWDWLSSFRGEDFFFKFHPPFFLICIIGQNRQKFKVHKKSHNTVDYRYLEFDGTMEKIRVNRSSTQEELRRYRKCGLFNNEREITRVQFWRAKTSIACPYSRNDFKHIRCFCCCFFLSVKFFESCETTDNF